MNKDIQRYTASERSNHWAVAILFFLAGLSGLALFHPSLFWLTGLFGGGAATRAGNRGISECHDGRMPRCGTTPSSH